MSQVVWITGASGGIGVEVAKLLAQKGWTIVASARDGENLERTTSGIEGIHILPVDVTDEVAMRNVANQIKSEYGRLDGLVHAVGSILLRPLHATSLDQFPQPKPNLSIHRNEIQRPHHDEIWRGKGRAIFIGSRESWHAQSLVNRFCKSWSRGIGQGSGCRLCKARHQGNCPGPRFN